ncbi:hypothetical protein M5K25_009162 [Dendrobium thyrsiflorum]|uniref:NB-ARC domain-containing protein n=1 Tax=Dendrobium thyrsiflorum TaxID=117978 RepID=A0ABD0V538_DENTH
MRRVHSTMQSMKKKLVKISKRALKIDPNIKRLEEAVQKLYRVSTTGVDTFLHLVEHAKHEHQKQQLELHGAHETWYFPTNDLIARGKAKKFVMQWLRKPSNEPRTTRYRNISLLSIVGHGGMGKTALLQHVYEDEISKEFDLKMWVCVSNNFDAKKVNVDMLECLKKERPRLYTLGALQGGLKEEVMSKKFLLMMDDIWVEDEEKDKSKWEDVLAPLASGVFGSKIMVTTRTDSVALMFSKVIRKNKEIVKLEGIEEYECLQLLNSHAFDGVENSNDHENLRVIARDIVKKLSRSPLAAKVIGGVLNDNLDEIHWRTVLERIYWTELYSSAKSSTKLFCILLYVPTRSYSECGLHWVSLSRQGMTMDDIRGRNALKLWMMKKKTLVICTQEKRNAEEKTYLSSKIVPFPHKSLQSIYKMVPYQWPVTSRCYVTTFKNICDAFVEIINVEVKIYLVLLDVTDEKAENLNIKYLHEYKEGSFKSDITTWNL